MTKRLQQRLFVIALALCTSVFAADCALLGGQTGQESKTADACGTERSHVDDTDVSTIGASANDVTAALSGPFETTFEWTRLQTATRVAIALSYAGNAAQRATHDGCVVGLELPVMLSIQTDDGRLDEHVSATLFATARDRGTFDLMIPLAGLAGSYDGGEAGANADSELHFVIDLADGATSGSLEVVIGRSRSEVAVWPSQR